MTKKKLNDFVNFRPDYFQLEEAQRNLTHVDEKLGYGDLELIQKDLRKFLNNRK